MSELPLGDQPILRECEDKFTQALQDWAEGKKHMLVASGELENTPSENIFLDAEKAWNSDEGAWMMLARLGFDHKGLAIEGFGVEEEVDILYGLVVIYKQSGEGRQFAELSNEDLALGTSLLISERGHVIADYGVLDPPESEGVAATIRDSKIVEPPEWINEALNAK